MRNLLVTILFIVAIIGLLPESIQAQDSSGLSDEELVLIDRVLTTSTTISAYDSYSGTWEYKEFSENTQSIEFFILIATIIQTNVDYSAEQANGQLTNFEGKVHEVYNNDISSSDYIQSSEDSGWFYELDYEFRQVNEQLYGQFLNWTASREESDEGNSYSDDQASALLMNSWYAVSE